MSQVQTVLGPVSSESLGRTLTHEHLSLNFEKFYIAPPENLRYFFEDEIRLDNVGLLRQYPYSSKYNLAFNDVDTHSAIHQEMLLYKRFGGGTIVENSCHGLGRNLRLMTVISSTTGVNIVAGTGHYVAAVQPQSVLNQSQEELRKLMVSELLHGCQDHPSVRCGFVGEVGSNWPLCEFEIRAIRATAEVQKQLGCPVSFHPGRHPEAPFEIMRLFLEAGGDARKAVMSHLDRTFSCSEMLLDFASLGCYCQFDLFGTECSYYQFNPHIDMPSDAERLSRVHRLLDEGMEERVLLAHDIHTKHRLMKFGGHGFSHILTFVLPRLLAKGVSQKTVDQISIGNPATWLSCSLDG